MKLIYKATIKCQDDNAYDYLFDDYEALREFIDDLYDKGYRIKEYKLTTLSRCDDCKKYEDADFCFLCFLLKNEYGINAYCMNCSPRNTIDILKYTERKDLKNE